MSMSISLNVVPSPYDRLDPVAAAIRWWTSQMAAVFQASAPRKLDVDELSDAKRLPPSIAVLLDETDAFFAQYVLPPGSPGAHRNALLLRLGDLTPIDPALLQISARTIERKKDNSLSYLMVMARRDRLSAIEGIARRKGARQVTFEARGQPDLALASLERSRSLRRSILFDAGLIGLIAVAASLMLNLWTMRIDRETHAVAAQEKAVRRAAIAAETTRRQDDIARALVDRGILRRRASVALDAMAALNRATPDNAWWTSIRWSPEETIISGASPAATAAIEKMSNQSPGWSIELSGALSAAPAGAPQAFELTARARKEAQKP
jgi:hypothetical protein